jgi:hypothetical protein
MSAEGLFQVSNMFALAGWAVLVAGVAMSRPWLRERLAGIYWPLVLSVSYALALAVGLGGEGGFSSLPAVRQLFANDWALLAGWIHYLAFDLFIGAWIARHTELAQLSRLILIPILPLTFLFGPVGLLLFLAIRFVYRGAWK